MKNLKAIAKTTPSMLVILLFGATLFITSCKDDEKDPAPSKKAMLTSGKWKITAYELKGSNFTTNLLLNTPDCYSDNFHEFKTDSKYVIVEGTNVCTPGTAPDYIGDNGVWSFVNDETKLRFEFPYIAKPLEDFQIVELTNESLIITHPSYDGNPDYEATITFVKQQ